MTAVRVLAVFGLAWALAAPGSAGAASPPVGELRRACAAGTLCVGAGRTYPTLSAALAAAREGNTIEVMGGTYHETAAIDVPNVTIRGVAGRPHFDCTGLRIASDKACLLIKADGVTLEGLEISGAVISDALGANGACIRNRPGVSFTLRDVHCHGSQDGMLTSGGTIVIEGSEFYDNGWTGQTHNVYLNGDCIVTVRGSTFRDARVGHEFKSRCRKTTISNSIFRSTRGSRNLDIPDGGETMVYRSTLVKEVGAESNEIVGFTPESCRYPGDMVLKEVHIVNSRRDAVIHNFDKCTGHPILLQDVTVTGILPMTKGYVAKEHYGLQ